MATDIQMKVVQHPNLEDVKYSVPEADVSRWEGQGWKVTDDTPSVPAGAEPVKEDPTVAQQNGLGLLPVAGHPTVEPTSTPTAQEAPTAADTPAVTPTTTGTAPAATTTATPTTTTTTTTPSGTSTTAAKQAEAGAAS